MNKKIIVTTALALSAPLLAENVPWFESNTPLTQAHKHLLNNELPLMFNSLVEVWQQGKNSTIQPHLNDFFLQSLQADCGQSLSDKSLPNWIHSVLVRRMALQSPGRDAYRAAVELKTNKDIHDITLTRWVSKTISTDDQFVMEQKSGEDELTTYTKRYNLNGRLPMGLYRIDITAKDQTSWSSWLILGEPKAEVNIRWKTQDEWAVEKNALLNPNCPLPQLETTIYDYVDNKYSEIWNESFGSDYPTSLRNNLSLEPGRYVLAISMQHQRWQGPIIVEQSQIISKTYEVSVEE